MNSLKEAVAFGRENLNEVTEVYVNRGRRAVAEYLNMSYNSVGHALQQLGLYNDDVKQEIIKRNREKEKSKNPFLVEDEMCAYLLGFILGDGSLRVKGESVNLDIYSNDRFLMEKLIKAFYDDKELSIRRYKTTQDGYYFDVYDRGVYKKLLEYGLKPRKSKDGCKLPKVSEGNKHHFIRGLFDADGSVTNNHKKGLRVYIYGHPSYMGELRENLPVPYKECKVGSLDGIAIYNMSGIKEFYEYLYKDASIYLERKKRRFDSVFGTCSR